MESLLVSSGLDTATIPSAESTVSSSEQEDLSARLSTLIVDDESGASFFWGITSPHLSPRAWMFSHLNLL
jgi:hypothetical protein